MAVASAGRQQLERAIEALTQPFRSEEAQPRGSELERQRQPVEATADLFDCLRVVADSEVRTRRLCARREQLHGVTVVEWL